MGAGKVASHSIFRHGAHDTRGHVARAERVQPTDCVHPAKPRFHSDFQDVLGPGEAGPGGRGALGFLGFTLLNFHRIVVFPGRWTTGRKPMVEDHVGPPPLRRLRDHEFHQHSRRPRKKDYVHRHETSCREVHGS